MSRLEDASKPVIGALMDDISLWLDTMQQSQVAIWCMKTAMVVEQVNARKRTPCYDQMEREELRLTSAIPIQTLMWLGRCSLRSLAAIGTDIWIDIPDTPKVAKGAVTTIVVGHLAIQVLTIHVRAEYRHKNVNINTIHPKAGQWDKLLIPFYFPTHTIQWPPPLTFTNGGATSIASLMDRWRIGIPALGHASF